MKGGIKQWNLKEAGGGEDNGLLEGGVGGWVSARGGSGSGRKSRE